MKLRAAKVWTLVVLAIGLTVGSCGPFRSARHATPVRHELAVDSTVLIIRIFNYQPVEVTVYLDTQQDRQRVGVVIPMHEAFFVLPSAEVMALDAFFLTVISSTDGVKPYRTGLINRNRTKITMVYVAVGEDLNKNGAFRGNAPIS